ncbi:pKID domain protein [Ancylostoma caninum]|uniref:PKID domain protein n=1 Tax=Ancylostoma caninum TaxID=29170 RepID=A0A368H2G7_ANCCA|nr:pKID domain protein [Ancylostoma caninum]
MSVQQGNGGQALSGEEVMSEDEARKRREQLNRRPSYRSISGLSRI